MFEQTILVIGNYLNGSTFRGNAAGFQLDCLLKVYIDGDICTIIAMIHLFNR